MIIRVVVLLAVSLASSPAASAADGQAVQPAPSALAGPAPPVAPEVVARDAGGMAAVRAIRVTEPMRIDGRLDEPVYGRERSVSDFVQSVPDTGKVSTERTEAWILFDDEYMYVTARCWDSAPPEQWTANEMRRDTQQVQQNDTFGVMFDTYLDRRNGFIFYTNPLGGFSDRTITDEGNPNPDWNPVWQLRTGRFDGGWTVEMAIPFRILRYRTTGGGQTWGLQLRRAIRRKNEWSHLTPIPASIAGGGGIVRISLAGSLVGVEVPPPGKNIEIKPYGISRLTTDRTRTPALSNDVEADIGVDLKYGVTPNVTADLTYNTDFAQVEVDEQQLNLTRFNLFFPEKREFFLEGRAIFEFARGSGGWGGVTPQLFYSRRIGLNNGRVIPIDAGGRLTGKIGRTTVGAMNVQTGDESVSNTPGTNVAALRIKRDILRRSYVGALFTNRSESVAAAGSNQAFGVDAGFGFYENVSMSGYVAQTKTPGLRREDASYQARFDYGADRYGARAEYLHVGNHFNPEVGFRPRANFNRTLAVMRFSPRPHASARMRKFTWEGTLEYIENGSGVLESRQQSGRFNTEFQNSDQFTTEATRNLERLVRPFGVSRRVTIPVGAYTFSDVVTSYQFGQQRRASGTVSVQLGEFYDGTIKAVSYSSGRVSLLPQMSLEPTMSITRVELPGGGFTTRIYRVRTDYAFSPRRFVSALVQYNSAEDAFSSNVRFRWEYQPGSELFVVYTDERDTASGGVPAIRNRALVVKINRLFQF